MMAKCNVLFCIDENFWQHLGVAITSLLLSNSESDFDIYVATAAEINETFRQQIEQVVAGLGNGTLHILQYREALAYADLPTHDHLTFAAYLRLFLTEFLPLTVDMVLYLDTDVLVAGDLRELWLTPLQGAYLGAAREPYDRAQREPLGFSPQDAYFNSGVMLIDVAKWRRDKVLARFLAFARSNTDKLPSVDQDILNSVFRGRICDIGYRWNWQALFVRFLPAELGLTRQEWLALKRRPSLVHYTSRYKPWYYRWAPHYKALYYKALERTPWSAYRPPDRSLKNWPTHLIKASQQQLEWHLPGVARRMRQLRSRQEKTVKPTL